MGGSGRCLRRGPDGDGGGSGRRGCAGTAFAALCACFSALWLLNLSGGFIEIPDNLPIVGNVDEAFFTMLLVGSLSYLGIEIPFVSDILKKGGRR